MKHKLIVLITLVITLLHGASLNAQEEAGATKAEYGNIVVYLETATWGQNTPYNKLCFTAKGAQAKTGCVPTAYAILMHYHKWPACANEKKVYHSGTGESMMLGHEYEWDNMLSSYSDEYTEEQATAFAKDLMRLYLTAPAEASSPLWLRIMRRSPLSTSVIRSRRSF